MAGKVSNASGVGAKVRVQATIRGQTMWQLREINGNSGLSGGTPGFIAHFGLGDATNVDLVRIEWPAGNVQELSDQTPDQTLKITEAVLIAPANPSSSLGGSVTLTSPTGDAYQWQLNGADLTGQTNRTLVLANIQASQQGRYSVVVTTGDTTQTNYTRVYVDTQFTKITTGPVVSDGRDSRSNSWGDYDNDGFVDLFAANSVWEAGVVHGVPGNSFLYHHNGDGTFARVKDGPLATMKAEANSGAFGDYDNDGFLDLFVGNANIGVGAKNFLYHNNGNTNAWLVIKPVGTTSNRSGEPDPDDYRATAARAGLRLRL